MDTQFNWNQAALVLVDPQIDQLHSESVIWDIIGKHLTEIDLVNHLKRLKTAAEDAGVPVIYSHVEVTEADYESMECLSGLQRLMKERRMCVPGKGARFHPELQPSENSIVLSSRRGPSSMHSDFAPQMRSRGLKSAVFAGAIANLCIESHVRDAVEEGFEAFAIADAIGALSKDSMEATLANLSLHATGLLSVEEALKSLADAKQTTSAI